MKWFKHFLTVGILCIYFIFFSSVNAQQYNTQYDTHYYINKDHSARVEMNIQFPGLSSEMFIREYGLIFPSSFAIENIKATSNNTDLTVTIEKYADTNKLIIQFEQPTDITKRTNNFILTYNHKNFFKPSGNIVEIILPTLGEKSDSNANISVHLPEGFNRKINIAKPIPSSIHNNVISWQNVKARTIYAVFGESQIYDLDLTYNLKNTENEPVYVDIAFPPETQMQHIYVESISPAPKMVYIDSDGNYLGRYNLLIGQSFQVRFKGSVEIFTKPQPDMLTVHRNQIGSMKEYLLSPKKYWDLQNNADNETIKKLSKPEDIYNFTSSYLTYNYARVKTGIKRLGASTILSDPKKAVCMEFTDLFVAIAREKGIYAREIQGYGFTDDQRLRPLSLVTDVLHSWPEYYDTTTEEWKPVDPTWANTSGIDYFNSFDLNHIAFAIHGKDSTTPYPAGTYKFSDSKDVALQVTTTRPETIEKILIEDTFKKNFVHNKSNKAEIKIINKGNTFVRNSFLEIKSNSLMFSPNKLYIDLIPPLGSKTFSVEYKSKKDIKKDTFEILLNNKSIKKVDVKATTHFEAWYGKILLSLIVFSIMLGLYLGIKKRRDDE
ncbi:MAG TPA: transglutaminase domain-containing protein [Candidatus Nitrosocosmicus sp.]|nr:transglutaminase domain-containing protein [Candidatus Nitrosocosmicus sp.]